MITRPTADWRGSGSRPAAFLDRVDRALQAFETELAVLDAASDRAVMAAVEHVVVALNEIDGNGSDFDTMDREDLCDYIDRALTQSGVDVEALAGRLGIDPAELTDQWRDW